MKKISHVIPILSAVLFWCVSGTSVYAQEINKDVLSPESLLINSNDIASIEELSAEILESANNFEADGFHAELSDLAFDDAFKVYIETGILDNPPDNLQELSDLLEQADVVWNVPVYSDDRVIIVQVSKALPLDEIDQSQLTDDEIAEAAAAAGKWQVVASTLYDEDTNSGDLIDSLSSFNSGNPQYEAFLIGGEPGIQSVIGIITDGSSIVGATSFQRDIMYTSAAQTRSNDKAPEVTLEENKIYTLDQFSEASDNLSRQSDIVPDATGGASSSLSESHTDSVAQYFVWGAVIIGILATAILIIMQIRKRSR